MQDNLRYVFIYKKLDTSQKPRQFAIRLYIQKYGHFTKSKTLSHTFLFAKSKTLYVTQFSMEMLKLTFILKNHDILRYVTFSYPKNQKLCKKQNNCVTFLYTKIWTLCVTQFFIEFLKLAEGGRPFYMQITMHFALYFNIQKTMHFASHFYIQKA